MIQPMRACFTLALALLLVTSGSANAQTAADDNMAGCAGSWQRLFGVAVLVLDCAPGFASEHDRAYMYARHEVDTTADWRTQLSFDDAVWLFDAGARGKASLIVDFHRDSTGLVAEFYDDPSNQGEVSYGLERGIPRSTRSRFPTVRVTAPDGWWVRDGRVNYNLRLQIDGPVFAAFHAEVWLDSATNDGIPDVVIDVHDPDGNGRPTWEIVQAQPPVSELSAIFRTLLMVNEKDNELPVNSYILWPHLGYAGKQQSPVDGMPKLLRTTRGAAFGIVKDYESSYPPIQVDWAKAKIAAVGEFVASRGRPNNWFVYSALRFGDAGRIIADFENPFAFYDLNRVGDGYPDVAIRDEYYPTSDQYTPPPMVGPVHAIRYSWDPTHQHKWAYKLDIFGRRPMPATVDVGSGVRLQTVPYAEYPRWIATNSWQSVAFVAVEPAQDWTSEGIYEGVCDCDLTKYWFGVTPEKPMIDFSPLAPGMRAENAAYLGDVPRLYVSGVDQKIHLFGADSGLWRVSATDSVRYSSISGKLLDQWERLEGGVVRQTLGHVGEWAIYWDDAGVSLGRGTVHAVVSTLAPPSDEATMRAFRAQVEASTSDGASADLSRLFDRFSMDRVWLPGAVAWDLRSDEEGFTLVFQLTNVVADGPEWARGLAPGRYLLRYRPSEGFRVRPAQPPRLTLSQPKVLGDTPTEGLPVRVSVTVRNDGDESAGGTPFVFFANRPNEVEQVVGSTFANVGARSSASVEVAWTPAGTGGWQIHAVALRPYAAPSEPTAVRIAAAPPSDFGAILQLQGLRPFAAGAITASLTLAMAIAGGIGLVTWRAASVRTDVKSADGSDR